MDDVNSFGQANPAEEVDWFSRLGSGPTPDPHQEVFDAEIVDDPNPKTWKGEPGKLVDRDAKSTQPDAKEWMSFWSNIVLRLGTDLYLDLAFSDVDEDIVTEADIHRIKLKVEERDRIARPFAEFSSKSKFLKKHGRVIISSGESIDAFLQIGFWIARVNRVAWKYKRMMANGYQKREPVQFKPPRMRVPQTAPNSEEVNGHERTRQSTTDTGTVRPNIGEGIILSPGSS